MLNIHIHNDGTGTDQSANYTFEVNVNGGVIATGTVRGHNRADGWRRLVAAIATADDPDIAVAIHENQNNKRAWSRP